MEEIRRAAEAYYENLPEEKKRYTRFKFREMDKNGDGHINLYEYVEYLDKDNNTALIDMLSSRIKLLVGLTRNTDIDMTVG
ncbi:hypothetical protein OIU84_027615 [Salix udensis]|uniref:EF-hand domain-containing protein n=1 Tax=Salix udensis TaxID=889485 RepID=A0AAD6P9Z1_9ROSI|nr:hypothetical protein OIU84_027615 [Salix udensis]